MTQHHGNQVRTGKVLFYSSSRGFGFIKPEGGGPKVHFHRNQLRELKKEEEIGSRKIRYPDRIHPGTQVLYSLSKPSQSHGNSPSAATWAIVKHAPNPRRHQQDRPRRQDKGIRNARQTR